MKHVLDQSGAFSHVFAFKPTGWEMGRKSGEDWINSSTKANITIYGKYDQKIHARPDIDGLLV